MCQGRNASYNWIAMTMMGKSLDALKKDVNGGIGKFTICTALRLAVTTLEALEDLHNVSAHIMTELSFCLFILKFI